MGSSKYKIINVEGKAIREHRYVMEQNIGRKLTSEEVVHHINRDEADNRIDNLQILSNSEHASLHGIDRGKKIKQASYRKRINLFLTDEAFAFLKSLPGTISEHMRRAIDDYLHKMTALNVSASASKRKGRE